MGDAEIKPLVPGLWDFEQEDIWLRDDPYRVDLRYFLNRTKGEITCEPHPDFLGPDDALIRKAASHRDSTPGGWEEIPALRHEEHHMIWRQWLGGTLQPSVLRICNTKSIGGFFKDAAFHFPDDADGWQADWEAWHGDQCLALGVLWFAQRGFAR